MLRRTMRIHPLVSLSLFLVSISAMAAPQQGISAIWANDGGDKVTQDELRASRGLDVKNRLWDGQSIRLFAAKNEVVSFNLVLEAAGLPAFGVQVKLDQLTGPGGAKLHSAARSGNGVFNWVGREIELFYVRYLRIEGLSLMGYDVYDERHVPKRLQRTFTGAGFGTGTWEDRPDHDKNYPDIAVPLEQVRTFGINAEENQSVWADIYVPRTAAPGIYQGNVQVLEAGHQPRLVPVELSVRNFALPDDPSVKTMLFYSAENVDRRYVGTATPLGWNGEAAKATRVRNRHFQLAHRHKISLIDSNAGAADAGADQPSPEWIARLNGTLFTKAQEYAGPGEAVGNGVFSVGSYGQWGWQGEGEAGMRKHSDAWMQWFAQNSPSTEALLYLIDESDNCPQIEQWSQWLRNNPGPGKSLLSFATIPLPTAATCAPSLAIATSRMTTGDVQLWGNAFNTIKSRAAGNKVFMYNASRPASGSVAIEDDGVAMREVAWGQVKKHIDRWFIWESTYYNNDQGRQGQTNVFRTAQTFGKASHVSESLGNTDGNYGNGEGVLFYPGTDRIFSQDSYELEGPIASLRLKHWRRGIQDADYLALARKIDARRTDAIIQRMVPKVLWENGLTDLSDPTWVRTDISWPTKPDVWEAARAELADIIESASL